MVGSRLIQIIAGVVLVLSLAAAGTILPGVIRASERGALRYTNVAVANVTPEIAIGNSIGAIKGIIVDVLWIRASMMKEKGLFYEANTLAEMITKMQPRFAQVWSMQGHNMAYNISVATNTRQERWEWVRKGIDLLRLQGIPNNENNIELYRELAYYFMHKVEGVSDDAHLYYKTELCREWHRLLGEPPWDHQARIEWIKEIADAPQTLEACEKRTPGVMALVETIRSRLSPFEREFSFDLNREFLFAYADWKAMKTSWYAKTLRSEEMARQKAAEGESLAQFFVAFDEIASDPAQEAAWKALLAHVRKKVLRESYNMRAEYMYELTRDWGPIDWRHGCAHTLYWAMLGAEKAEIRYNNEEDIYKIINNDRMSANAMQDLARFSQITFDPMSNDMPDRMPDMRWIVHIDRFFEHLYKKHINVDGWGSDTFIAFHENFLSSAVRELYRMGHRGDAENVYKRLDSLYGTGHVPPNTKYSIPMDVFVRNETYDEYEMQPHIATTDVQLALYFGIRAGLGQGKQEVYDQAKEFAAEVLRYFRENHYNNFVNKFGEARIAGIINDLEQVERSVYIMIMMNSSIPLDERLRIYNLHTPEQMRREIYDAIVEPLTAQIAGSRLGGAFATTALLPEPPGMAEYREALAQKRAAEEAAGGGRAEIEK